MLNRVLRDMSDDYLLALAMLAAIVIMVLGLLFEPAISDRIRGHK